MKRLLILGVIFSFFLSNFALAEENHQKGFSDIDVNTNYRKAILWMANNEVINGNPDGTFKPDKCVNRAELLKMLYKMLEVNLEDYKNTELFKDTPDNQWYSDYVRTARARNTVQGYADGKFRPEQCVKRVEAIKMAVLEFNNSEIPKYKAYYGDLRDGISSEWYYPYLDYALSANVLGLSHIEQTDATGFKYFPADNMSRKEVTEMLYSLKTIQDNDLESYDQEFTPDALALSAAKVAYTINQILFTI